MSARAQARDLKTMSVSSVTVVGIDVAKTHVDVCVLGTRGDVQQLANDAESHSVLTAALQPPQVGLVAMEAAGGYEAGAGLGAAGSRPARGSGQPAPGSLHSHSTCALNSALYLRRIGRAGRASGISSCMVSTSL
jgi:hypothetical protein